MLQYDHYIELLCLNSIHTQHLVMTFILLWPVFLAFEPFLFLKNKVRREMYPTFKKEKPNRIKKVTNS